MLERIGVWGHFTVTRTDVDLAGLTSEGKSVICFLMKIPQNSFLKSFRCLTLGT